MRSWELKVNVHISCGRTLLDHYCSKETKARFKTNCIYWFFFVIFFPYRLTVYISDTSKCKSKAKDKKHLQKSNESLSRIWPVKFENQELDAKRKQMLSRELRDSSSRAVKNFKFSRQKTKKNTGDGGTHAPIFFIVFVGKFCWNELSFPRR